MEKNFDLWVLSHPTLKKLIMELKIAFLLVVVSVSNVFATPAYSQVARVSLDMENKSLEQVMDEIERQSEFYFVFNQKQIDVNRVVNIQEDNKLITDILPELFKGTNVHYVVFDRKILLTTDPIENNFLASASGNEPQQKQITGTVTAKDGKPIPGVNVVVTGTTQGTVTDIDGKYSIDVSPEAKSLTFSFIGMQSQELGIGSLGKIDITMVESATDLGEVVVIGYGTQKKGALTGSISQANTQQLESVPVYNIGEALKGQSSGVQVKNNSGAPGSRIEVRIRGGNSMIGSNDPLYVVDGFPLAGGIDLLNPSDIESISILKDASATAIYGSRGANGVVIITSKRGKIGQKGLISINSYFGQQEVAKRYQVLDPKQYAVVANEWMKNSGLDPYFNVDDVSNLGTDWQDVIFRVAPIQNHTITFSGSSEKTRYSLSGNYYNQEGVVINSGIQRGSFRLNLDHDIKSWLSLSENLIMSRREQFTVPVDNGSRGNTVLSGALSAPPTLPVYDANGQYTRIEQQYPFVDPTDMRNPLLYSPPWKNRILSNSILENTALVIKFREGLSFRTLLGVEYETDAGDTFTPIIFSGDKGSASLSNSYMNSFLNENTLNYVKNFASSNLDALVGFTYQTNTNTYSGISVSGFPNNITEDYNIGSATTISPPSSSTSEWTLVSWLGRANYSFKNKYYITASVRADGSSRFGKDNKWGIFPSGALAWRLSDESFMKNINFINNLKLRASYGITGNTALSPYQSLDRLSLVRYIDGGQAESIGYVPSGISNSKLKWESTGQLDIGFDLGIINSRIGFTFDYYKKNTRNLLASVPLPPSVGFGSILQNIGEIQNEGIEFSVTADILTGGLKWDVSAQISSNKNKVIKLEGGHDIISTGSISGLSGFNIARVGQPLGMFYGYIEDGLNDQGLIKYKDINNDGVINPLDRVIMGNPYPDFIFGFNSNFSYKGFDLSIFLEGVYGNNIFFETGYTNLNSFQRGQNQLADLFGNYWTAEDPNPNAKYPKISAGTQMAASNRFMEDGSYLRMKTLELGYNIPIKKVGISWFNRARIYLKANNLFTLTHYIGLDPDVNTTGNDSQVIGSRLNVGIDTDGYPNARIYAAGIQLDF
jgi:TonB-linked SusC/RagA family outer membrane protein